MHHHKTAMVTDQETEMTTESRKRKVEKVTSCDIYRTNINDNNSVQSFTKF